MPSFMPIRYLVAYNSTSRRRVDGYFAIQQEQKKGATTKGITFKY